MATTTRRICVRPGLDEPLPDWARPLIPLSWSWKPDLDGVGISYECVPAPTAEALQDLFPAPPAPQRQRAGFERRYKPYVKTWATALYFALLPYALAKQVSLFPGSDRDASADMAVLCFRRLSDLAKMVGISYDRLQKWMTVLLILGFVKRFREGRQMLYVLPICAYVPSPSPEAVLKKLDELIESQFVEKTLPDGRVVWLDRCPEWTTQLIEIRSRFILRYHLPTVIERHLPAPLALAEKLLPSPISAEERSSDQAFQMMLQEVSAAVPEASRPEIMRRLLPILARSYAAIIESTSGKSPQHPPVGRSGEVSRTPSFSSNLDIATAQHGKACGVTATESRCGASNPDLAGVAADRQSRFDATLSDQETSPNSLQSGTDAPALKLANVDSMAGESLTLRCNNSNNTFHKEDKNVNVRDAESQKAENRKKAEMLAALLRVPQNVNFYTKLFNQARRGEIGEDLIKAIYIYTLSQEQAGDITTQEPDALGKYFYGVFKRWGPQRTYEAACQAYRKKWQSKTPQGIRPRDKEVIDPFMPFGYEQIADMIRRGVRAEEAGWLPLPLGSSPEVPEQSMDEQEAEALARVIREQAWWYLHEPTCRRILVGETVVAVVEAKQDSQPCTFTSWDQWRGFHEQMLTPPADLDPCPEIGGGETRREGEAPGPESQGAREGACARAACALFAYLTKRPAGLLGNLDWVSLASSLSCAELAVLGDPIRFPRERCEQPEEPDRGPVAHEGLNVELGERGVLTYEQFQVLLAQGAYHGACVEVDDGGFLPRQRYEELLAAGEYVELDDGTPIRADAYETLRQRVQVVLEREEVATRHAEAAAQERADPTASFFWDQPEPQMGSGQPRWWREGDLDEGEGARMDRQAAWRYHRLLQEALAPHLYRLQARPSRTQDARRWTLELSSLSSGWILRLETAAQVEALLDTFDGERIKEQVVRR